MPGSRIGFACLWDRRDPAGTWSHTPWQLRAALRAHAEVHDLGVLPSAATELALKLGHLRIRAGRLTSGWSQSAITDRYCRRVVSRAATAARVDTVLQIQDLGIIDRPYFLYQDLSFDALLRLADQPGGLPPGLAVAQLPAAVLRRRRDRQLQVYAQAAGVVTMSRWLARSLVESSGLAPEKVHVVNPGRSALVTGMGGEPASGAAGSTDVAPIRERPRRRLLLVGKGFIGKGGDLVIAALSILRREVDPDITLTVVGPRAWPLPGEVPAGVRFLGALPLSQVAGLYQSHDLLVMPSRLEGFGIVFAEALAVGLPCVGRRAFAMPELITPGVNGDLVDGDDPAALATTVAGVLGDDPLYEQCRARAPATAAHFTWDRAAREMADIMRRHRG